MTRTINSIILPSTYRFHAKALQTALANSPTILQNMSINIVNSILHMLQEKVFVSLKYLSLKIPSNIYGSGSFDFRSDA